MPLLCPGMFQALATPLNSTRASFMKKLQGLLGDDYKDFELLDNIVNSSYVQSTVVSCGIVSLMDCLAYLRNILICGKYENINYVIVTQYLVNDSILSLHLGIWL